jgi:hypothetical protein
MSFQYLPHSHIENVACLCEDTTICRERSQATLPGIGRKTGSGGKASAFKINQFRSNTFRQLIQFERQIPFADEAVENVLDSVQHWP